MTVAKERGTKNFDSQLDSAYWWMNRLPRYAADQHALASPIALAAGILSVFTGLAVWTAIANSSNPWAQAAVAIVSFAAAKSTISRLQMRLHFVRTSAPGSL